MPNQSGVQGITTDTEGRMVLDAGALYRNYSQVGQELIGATRGGATFELKRDERDIPVDGGPGPMEGLVRVVSTTVKLTVTLPEISAQTFQDILRGGTAVSDDGSRTEYQASNEIINDGTSSGDYYLNVALVADLFDGSGKRVIWLDNVLVGQGSWSIKTEDRGEWGLKVTFRAHYKTSDLTSPPYKVNTQYELLRDWDPAEDGSGQTQTERIHGKDGTLGSGAGSDTNDPSWATSPAALTYGSDDYVKEASTPWTTS